MLIAIRVLAAFGLSVLLGAVCLADDSGVKRPSNPQITHMVKEDGIYLLIPPQTVVMCKNKPAIRRLNSVYGGNYREISILLMELEDTGQCISSPVGLTARIAYFDDEVTGIRFTYYGVPNYWFISSKIWKPGYDYNISMAGGD